MNPALRAVRAVTAGLGVVLLVAAGVGWLYTLRHTPALAVGPRLAEALPLQRLAGTDGQPLFRLAVVWLATGLAAGALLAWVPLRLAALWAAATALVVLALSTAVSDAVTESQSVVAHLAPQLARPSIWCAALFVGIGSGASAHLRASLSRRRPAPRRQRAQPPACSVSAGSSKLAPLP